MATGYIEHTIRPNWTVTQNSIVGPTTDTTIRKNSLLPHPDARSTGTPDYDTINKDNDVNTIYLDPANGSDTNAGTDLSSDAILTFNRALALITSTRRHIHIERTDSLTDSQLTETLSGFTTIHELLKTIQVASGQTVTFRVISGYYGHSSTTVVIELNGITTIGTELQRAPYDVGVQLYGRWFRIEAPFRCGSPRPNETIQDTIFVSTGLNQTGLIGGSTSAEACIDMGVTPTSFLNVVIANIGTVKNALRTTSTSIDMKNIVFYNFENGISTSTITTVTNFHSNIFHRIGTLIKETGVGGLNSIPITNSLLNSTSDGLCDTSDSSNVKLQDPLFRNEKENDFRLTHVGVIVSGSGESAVYYPLSSPAVDIGSGGKDAGAFDFTYTQNADSKQTFTFPSDLAPDVKLIPRRVNYEGFNDIQGNFHNTWDKVKSQIDMDLPGSYWTGSDFAHSLKEMLQSKGLKRYYPHGIVGIFAGYKTITPTTSAGQLLIEFTGLARNLPRRSFIGWIVQIKFSGASETGFYEIIGDVALNKYEVEFIRWDTVPAPAIAWLSATDARIVYFPCLIDMDNLELLSEYYSEDEASGTIFKPWYKIDETDVSAEWHTRRLVLRQTKEEGTNG